MNLDLQIDVSVLVGTVLSLRRRAEAECLQPSLGEADALLNITPDNIRHWEWIVDQGQAETSARRLALPLVAQSTKTESLTRLHEWLLGVMFSIPYLAQWHQELSIPRLRSERYRVERYLNKVPIGDRSVRSSRELRQRRKDWRQLIMRTWLVDSLEWDMQGGYAASRFTTGQDSELTILAAGSSDVITADETDLDRMGEETGLLRQPPANLVSLRYLKDVEKLNELGLPSPNVPRNAIERAARALDQYAEEPVATLIWKDRDGYATSVADPVKEDTAGISNTERSHQIVTPPGVGALVVM
jgi:hypothetical protein